MKTNIEIINYGGDYNRVVVETGGYEYACVYAPSYEPLTNERIMQDWKNDRHAFTPYNRMEDSPIKH